MYSIVVGAAISRPRAIDNRPYMRIVVRMPRMCVPNKMVVQP